MLLVGACAPEPRWIAVATGGRGVTLFDGDVLHTAAWSLAAQPTALGSTGDGAGVLVGAQTGTTSGVIGWLRRADGEPVAQQALAGPAIDLALDREGRRVFVLQGGAEGGLTVLRAHDLAPVRTMPICAEPASLSFTREGDRAYVICRSGLVAEVDTRLLMVVRTAPAGRDSGRACGAGRGALSANGTLLYVPCANSGQLLYLDRATLTPWDSVPVGAGAAVVAVTGDALAVTLVPDSDRVVLVDLRTKTRVRAVATPPNPVAVALSASGRLAFVATAGRGGVWGVLVEIDTRTGAELRRAGLGPGTRAVQVWPGQGRSRMSWGRDR